jgi:hypothetical protein
MIARQLKNQGSVPGRGKIFLFSTESRTALGPTQPPILLGLLSPGVQQPGKGDHPPPSTSEVTNV